MECTKSNEKLIHAQNKSCKWFTAWRLKKYKIYNKLLYVGLTHTHSNNLATLQWLEINLLGQEEGLALLQLPLHTTQTSSKIAAWSKTIQLIYRSPKQLDSYIGTFKGYSKLTKSRHLTTLSAKEYTKIACIWLPLLKWKTMPPTRAPQQSPTHSYTGQPRKVH